MRALPDMTVRNPEGLARVFRYFGEVEAPRLGSPVYTAYCLGIAEDPELLALASKVDPGQPAPNILFAAVQELLLEDPEASPEAKALSVFYPAISREPIPDRSPWEAFRAFCLAHGDRLVPRLRTGRTQTCVVHRCAAILPAFAEIPRIAAAGDRVALLEIGPSAGLNLRLDRYRYDYGDGLVWGDPGATPLLRCETRGSQRPPLPGALEIVARRGLELNPIDLEDPAERRWIQALVWPEHAERARAMEEALRHARSVPIEIERGDATTDIERHIGSLPTDAARILFATQVFYQIPAEGHRAILDGIASASREAPVDFVLLESTGEGDSRIDWFWFAEGEEKGHRVLADCDSHGRWVAWRAT